MHRIQSSFTELFSRLGFEKLAKCSVHLVLVEGYGGDGARLLSEVCRGRTRGNMHKMEDGKIRLDIRKSVFTTGVGCREVVGSLFLEIFNHQLNMPLNNLIQLGLC